MTAFRLLLFLLFSLISFSNLAASSLSIRAFATTAKRTIAAWFCQLLSHAIAVVRCFHRGGWSFGMPSDAYDEWSFDSILKSAIEATVAAAIFRSWHREYHSGFWLPTVFAVMLPSFFSAGCVFVYHQ